MDVFQYTVIVIGGILAGIINTLAGNGSAITLTILSEMMGLPGNIANATNRIGIVGQSFTSFVVFQRKGLVDFSRTWHYLILMILGSLGGVWVALIISNEAFIEVFRFLMVFMLIVILIKPERWLRETDIHHKPSLWMSIPIALLIGFYGGFIQMGMGIFFLIIMVLGAKFSIADANILKIAGVGIYTFIALAIFAFMGIVDWEAGIIIAIAQTIGGYLGAIFASNHPNANKWAHRLLIAMVIISIIQLFDLTKWIFI
ncbi:MAG: sulfite exporter TauE/SafE family protein [Bacteroidetes bacterium]|nr:sulfite exporter TauE/SafE family protein [Bacteroidota bacterium]